MAPTAGVQGAKDVLKVEFFFFNDTATTEIYTLSLHDALPIAPEPLDVLHMEGTIEAELGAQLGDVLRVRGLGEHELHGVAWNETREREHDRARDQQRGDGDEQSAREITSQHASLITTSFSGPAKRP